MASAEEWIATQQRSINCLGDPSAAVRKRALTTLSGALEKETPEMRLHIFVKSLLKPLLRLFEDSTEKCRELSISLFQSLSVHTPPEAFLPYTIPVLKSRLGPPASLSSTEKYVEPVEEIREALVKLLAKIAERTDVNLNSYLDDITVVICRTLLDDFHNIRKESCKVIMDLAKLHPDRLALYVGSLIKPLITGVGHRHWEVRVITLQTLTAIILCGSSASQIDEVLSQLKALIINDHHVKVRIALVRTVTDWLVHLIDRYSYQAKLLPILLHALSDELPAVQTAALEGMKEAGDQYEKDNEEEFRTQANFGDVRALAGILPAPFSDRPTLGSRLLVRHRLGQIINSTLPDLADWTVNARVRSASMLRNLMIYAEEYVTQHLEAVLMALYKSCRDSESLVVQKSMNCLEVIGLYVSPDTYMPIILPHICGYDYATLSKMTSDTTFVGRRTNTNTDRQISAMIVLSKLVKGATVGTIDPHLAIVVQALLDHDVVYTEDTTLKRNLLEAVSMLIDNCRATCKSQSKQLFTILLTVSSSSLMDSSLRQTARAGLEQLASAVGANNSQELCDHYFDELLHSATVDYNDWTKISPNRFVFHNLLKTAGLGVILTRLRLIVPIFVANTHFERDSQLKSKDPELRISCLGLLDDLLSSSEAQHLIVPDFAEHFPAIIQKIIIPNAIWNVGKVAATVRLAAMGCLKSLLSLKSLVSSELVMPLLQELLPPTLTALDDDSMEIRIVVSQLMERLLEIISPHLTDEQHRQIYPELIKRLNDSNDQIRIMICLPIISLLLHVPKSFGQSPHFPYIAKCVLIHMDDRNQSIQVPFSVMTHAPLLSNTTMSLYISSHRFFFLKTN
eukprot:TRINITY_DN6159_c0_g1_i1.p1 TRINITY_DN6159_c0_g1~~TRINITY_DN6159_c0_g1_i1.p1  ORF type:complete len:852 (+),score=132.86 TRINITY_DN6159_c0_g1_i1:162-2717(+)